VRTSSLRGKRCTAPMAERRPCAKFAMQSAWGLPARTTPYDIWLKYLMMPVPTIPATPQYVENFTVRGMKDCRREVDQQISFIHITYWLPVHTKSMRVYELSYKSRVARHGSAVEDLKSTLNTESTHNLSLFTFVSHSHCTSTFPGGVSFARCISR
jgi:hypothetical protein